MLMNGDEISKEMDRLYGDCDWGIYIYLPPERLWSVVVNFDIWGVSARLVPFRAYSAPILLEGSQEVALVRPTEELGMPIQAYYSCFLSSVSLSEQPGMIEGVQVVLRRRDSIALKRCTVAGQEQFVEVPPEMGTHTHSIGLFLGETEESAMYPQVRVALEENGLRIGERYTIESASQRGRLVTFEGVTGTYSSLLFETTGE
jgi:hypothetical protein